MEQDRAKLEPQPPRGQSSWLVRGIVILVVLAGAAYIVLDTDMFKDEAAIEQRQVTSVVQNVLVRAIEAYREGGGKLGEWTQKELLAAVRTNEVANQLLAYAPTGLIRQDEVLDGFERPMQVTVIPGPPPGVRIISAGLDGRMGTSDDIILRRAWPQPPATQPSKETTHEGGRIQRKPPAGREHLDTSPSRF